MSRRIEAQQARGAGGERRREEEREQAKEDFASVRVPAEAFRICMVDAFAGRPGHARSS